MEGSDDNGDVPCNDPAATRELLAHQRLPHSQPPDKMTVVSGPGETEHACFLEKPTGNQPLSHEVLLTITFPQQRCPILRQTPGSSIACSRSLAVPRLRLHLAQRIRCSFCWCRDVWGGCQHFYLFISSASQELFPAFDS